MRTFNRRSFLRTTVMGGVAATLIDSYNTITSLGVQEQMPASAAITTGDSRVDLAFRALHPFAKQIRQFIGNRRVVLKPNDVSINVPLCATHVDTLEGMEGDGPSNGTAVDHRVCVASTDWLAADRVAVELMGVDFANIGHRRLKQD